MVNKALIAGLAGARHDAPQFTGKASANVAQKTLWGRIWHHGRQAIWPPLQPSEVRFSPHPAGYASPGVFFCRRSGNDSSGRSDEIADSLGRQVWRRGCRLGECHPVGFGKGAMRRGASHGFRGGRRQSDASIFSAASGVTQAFQVSLFSERKCLAPSSPLA